MKGVHIVAAGQVEELLVCEAKVLGLVTQRRGAAGEDVVARAQQCERCDGGPRLNVCGNVGLPLQRAATSLYQGEGQLSGKTVEELASRGVFR